MRISYLKDNKKHTTQSSNSDLTISETRDGNRTTITITANAEIILHKADVSYPCHINYKDMYFLNGYQSWTDTKEPTQSQTAPDARESCNPPCHKKIARAQWRLQTERRI